MSTSLWRVSWNSQAKSGSPLIPRLLMIHIGWLTKHFINFLNLSYLRKKIMLFFTFKSLKYVQEHSTKYILRKEGNERRGSYPGKERRKFSMSSSNSFKLNWMCKWNLWFCVYQTSICNVDFHILCFFCEFLLINCILHCLKFI